MDFSTYSLPISCSSINSLGSSFHSHTLAISPIQVPISLVVSLFGGYLQLRKSKPKLLPLFSKTLSDIPSVCPLTMWPVQRPRRVLDARCQPQCLHLLSHYRPTHILLGSWVWTSSAAPRSGLSFTCLTSSFTQPLVQF